MSIPDATLLIQNRYAVYDSLFAKHPDFIAPNFDFPVGKPNATGYYNAQKFTENNHLGDDWNGIGGGNSDLGDAVYSIANGYVSFAQHIKGGWGNVIRIVHRYEGNYYESVYAHCQTIKVKEGDLIKKGTLIGTIGTANGIYLAHLHLEIRDNIFMDIGGGYAEDTKGYIDPTKFIQRN
ncbi:murein hydrolase activator EnvC [Aquimarina sp. RZ0]|uniref:murein hydrolase activator EnvC family protein n=1 Tax=Aquimarina sp. RZ0 TaxID=2607730 RepID=UPI0011F0EEE5|nr:M23 family metallopeptidase [Aquimarina sp. RZ0]KAA1247049.1 M23 family metallopeptidase [Aquimarina sp. RZ0]